MRKIDFISASPYLSIFEKGANQTIFGGILFLINGIIFIILAIIYINDYCSNPNYSYDYTLVRQNIINQDNWLTYKHEDIFYSYIDFEVALSKDRFGNDEKNLSNNFFVIDTVKLSRKEKDSEGYKIITENDDCVIKQGKPYQKNGYNFELCVIYRCHGKNGTDCSIREEDKITIDSYYLDFAYRGYNIDHQSEVQISPIEEISKGDYFVEEIQFLENTNIVFLNWNLIEYEEKKGIFGQIFDKITGKKSTYYGRQLISQTIYTDDGHMKNFPTNNQKWRLKDENGNSFIMLLYIQNAYNFKDYDRYTRTAKSIFTSLGNIFALTSTVKTLITLVYSFLFAKSYDNYKIVENILKEKLKVNINDKINELKDMKDTDLEKKIELKTDLIMNSTEENKIKNEEDENNIDEIEENKIKTNSDVDLVSPKFFDFLCNKIYFNCC